MKTWDGVPPISAFLDRPLELPEHWRREIAELHRMERASFPSVSLPLPEGLRRVGCLPGAFFFEPMVPCGTVGMQC